MRIAVTGACGFVGSSILRAWAERGTAHTFIGIDNLSRPGSEINRKPLRALGVQFSHGDLRLASDADSLLREVDWVIEAAANPSVLAGVGSGASSRQLIEHNLIATLNVLETCRRTGAGFILLSTSRVYSVRHLSNLPVHAVADAFQLAPDVMLPGVSSRGLDETFSTASPVSLYGATKLASEQLALEYGAAFDFPVWINRCGVLAGPGQFGRADQGIFSYWIHRWSRRLPLAYIGFNGSGHQVRDCLHPRDLVSVLDRQMAESKGHSLSSIVHISGGQESGVSLSQCSQWCEARFGRHEVTAADEVRPFDIPWLILDHRLASDQWNWRPETSRDEIFSEIAAHAEANPDWLSLTND